MGVDGREEEDSEREEGEEEREGESEGGTRVWSMSIGIALCRDRLDPTHVQD